MGLRNAETRQVTLALERLRFLQSAQQTLDKQGKGRIFILVRLVTWNRVLWWRRQGVCVCVCVCVCV
jgi:hypothetical protein